MQVLNKIKQRLKIPAIDRLKQMATGVSQAIIPDELMKQTVQATGQTLQEMGKMPFRVGASILDIGQRAQGQPIQPFNIPGLGQVKTYQQEAGETAGQIVEGQKPLYSALKPFAQVPLEVYSTAKAAEAIVRGVQSALEGSGKSAQAGFAKVPRISEGAGAEIEQMQPIPKNIQRMKPNISKWAIKDLAKETSKIDPAIAQKIKGIKIPSQGISIDQLQMLVKDSLTPAQNETITRVLADKIYQLNSMARYPMGLGVLQETGETAPEAVRAFSESFKYNAWAQVGESDPNLALELNNIDISRARSVNEAAEMLKKGVDAYKRDMGFLHPEVESSVKMAIENYRKSTNQAMEASKGMKINFDDLLKTTQKTAEKMAGQLSEKRTIPANIIKKVFNIK